MKNEKSDETVFYAYVCFPHSVYEFVFSDANFFARHAGKKTGRNDGGTFCPNK